MQANAPRNRKVLSLEELLRVRARARRDGKKVVQCHGCFDIVHPGHIRHLQYATRQGAFLLVTLTGDAAMNKGDGRPLIPQELRAENLAALDSVDWVYIHPSATAADLLEQVRPDVYVKGREYETNDDPRFQAERATVETHGGRVLFSSGDVVFSSTALIAAMEETADPYNARLRRLVDDLGVTAESVDSLVARFRGRRVCVVGEAIIDTYVLCDRPEIAGESPVMALRPIEWRSYDGGAAIVARHLAAMGAQPTLVTALPEADDANALRQRLLAEGVETRTVRHDGPMLEKQRFLVGSQKVMKLDLIQPLSLDAARREELIDLAVDASDGADAAIVADFGQGLLSPAMMPRLCGALRSCVETLAGDVSGRRSSLLCMREMDLLTPSEADLRDAMHDYDTGLSALVYQMLEQTRSRAAIVTLGADGLIAFDRCTDCAQHKKGGEAWRSRLATEHVPALTPHAVDELGCGDALLAAATLAIASGASIPVGAAVGAIAAAAQAQRLGNTVVGAADLRRGATRLAGGRLTVKTQPAARLVV